MRERKKTGVHGTLEMISLAWKFNSKQLLCKTLNSRMNNIETRAILNIVKTDRKWAPEGNREGLELIRKCFSKGSDKIPGLLLLWKASAPTKKKARITHLNVFLKTYLQLQLQFIRFTEIDET